MRYLVVVLLVVAITSQISDEQDLLVEDGQAAFNSAFCDCNNETICEGNFNSTNITGFNNKSLVNNTYGIKNIKSYKLRSSSRYSFPSLPWTPPIVTAGVMYQPDKKNLVNKTINGVVFYFHPTIFGKYNGPSTRTTVWDALGTLYASQNYVFVATDYLGYNSYPEMVHPYALYP